MHWHTKGLRKVSITVAVASMLLLLVLTVWVPVSAANAYEGISGQTQPIVALATPAVNPTIEAETANEQLRKLQRDNERSLSAWIWNNGTAFFSSLALILGGIVTVFKYFSDRDAERKRRDEEEKRWLEDRRADREKRNEEQQHWLKNQETEREKRAEERFQKIVEGLGSERIEAKVGAAITLRTFLQAGYEQFYRQAFDLAVAHLRLRKVDASTSELPDSLAPVLIDLKGTGRQERQPTPYTTSFLLDSLSQALITVFKESFPLARKESKKVNASFDPQLLDATNVQLDHAHLVGSDLVQAWLIRASLRNAHLRFAQLEGATLIEAQFEGATLIEAQLKGADLYQAQFKGANLYGAQLGGAYLVRVQFKGANLTRVQFKGANLYGAQLEGANLHEAQLEGADLEGANLREAQLKGANPEAAVSLKDTKMYGAIGLTPEQREKCIEKGAIFDDVQQPSPSSLSSAQSNDIQASPSLSVQESTPTPDTGESIE
jgi:uncharacterized protein YjbI with pentapeptide repeats